MPGIEAIIVAVVTAVGGVVGYEIKARSDKNSTNVADWAKFSEETRTWTEKRLAERDEAIDELRAEVTKIRAELASLSNRYQAALRYVVVLWSDNRRDPPVDIAHDLPDPPWTR